MRSEQVTDDFGTFTEIIEDDELAELIYSGVQFQVIEDEWDAEYNTRTIKRIKVVEL